MAFISTVFKNLKALALLAHDGGQVAGSFTEIKVLGIPNRCIFSSLPSFLANQDATTPHVYST